MVWTIVVHVLGLGVVLAGIVLSGSRPQVLLYAFIVDYLLRLLTIEAMLKVQAGRWLPALQPAVPYLSSPPEPGRDSYPVTVGESGRAVGLGGYLVALAVLTYLGFVLANVGADRELDLNVATFAGDLRWAGALALVYWAESLAARTIVVDVGATREVNYGYNSREVTVLAFAVLTGAAVVVVRQSLALPASGWAMLGPLVGWRFLYDLLLGVKLARRPPGR